MKSINSRLLAIFACLLWATAFLGVKVGLRMAPPFLFAGIRFMGAGVAVLFVNRKKAALKQMVNHWPIILLTGFLQTFLLYSFFFNSLIYMRASTGAIVNGLGPLVIAVTAHFALAGNKLKRPSFSSSSWGSAV